MPQFTVWNVPSSFPDPNALFDPARIDLLKAQSASALGNLDIERQKLGLERERVDRLRQSNDALAPPGNGDATGTGGGGGASYEGAGGGGSFLGELARIESGDRNIVSGVDKDSRGLTLAQGGNPAEISQGHFQISTPTWRDFAGQAGVDVAQYPNAMSAPREVQARVASVIPFSRFGPRTQQLMHQRFGDFDPSQTVGTLAGLGPRVAPAAPGVRYATPAVPGGSSAPPGSGGHDDPASVAAVKRASLALLAMPEADAAVAYGPVVQDLQRRGLAMNAPPTYPGHAALQTLVGDQGMPVPPVPPPGGPPPPLNPNAGPRAGTAPVVTGDASGDMPPAAVEPSRVATRLGGVDAAGPAAPTSTPNVPSPAPPPVLSFGPGMGLGIPLPNSMGPGSPAATAVMPPSQAPQAPPAASPAPTQQTGTPGRPPILQPPPAPSRVVPQEPTYQSGPYADLTAAQARLARTMALSDVPPAQLAAHMEQMRQANRANQQQAADRAAAETQANYERQRQYQQDQIAAAKDVEDRRRQAEADARAAEDLRMRQAEEKRKEAEAADPIQGKDKEDRINRTLLTIGPKIMDGTATEPEKRQYALMWDQYRAGPVQQIPDGKGGTMMANVPRQVPDVFPVPPGRTNDPVPIPGTERPPEMAPPTVVGGMLANGVGQRKIMAALEGLQAHPASVGALATQPEWLLQRTDPEGVRLRAAIADVAGHEFHDLSGAAVSPTEAARLKPYIPNEKDTAEALKSKLTRMLDQNRETMLQSYRTYGPENGGRRLPAVEDAILGSIPQAALDGLAADPKGRAREFDAKYGKGAAKLALSQQ